MPDLCSAGRAIGYRACRDGGRKIWLKDKADLVVVTYADMPLLKTETLQLGWLRSKKIMKGLLTLLTVELDDPHGFGRIVRGLDGARVQAIVEDAVATPEQKAIRELNASAYCFRSDWLWTALKRIKKSAKGEYYLTDVVEIAVAGWVESTGGQDR